MTDLEIARYVRLGRRQGFVRAAAAAFCGLLVASPIVALSGDPFVTALGMALGAMGGLGAGAMFSSTLHDVERNS